MSDDVTTLLDRATPATVEAIDYVDLARRGQRRRRAKRLGGVTAAVAAVALVPVVMSGMATVAPDVAVIVEQPADPISFDVRLRHPDRWTEPASQTEAEARRDGVPVSLARVPTEIRAGNDGGSVPARDGLRWVHGPGDGTLANFSSGCHSGELCRPYYRELLLVDQDDQIVLAHALPGNLGAGSFGTASDGSGDLIGWFSMSVGESGSLTSGGDVIIFRFGTTPGDREVRVYPGNNSPFVEGGLSLLSADGEPIVLPDGWTVLPPDSPLPAAADPGRNGGSIDTEELERLLNRPERMRTPAGEVRAPSALPGLDG